VKVIERQRRLQRRKEGRTCIGVPDKNAALELVDGRGNDFHLSGGVLVLGREGGEEGGGKREMSRRRNGHGDGKEQQELTKQDALARSLSLWARVLAQIQYLS